MMDPNLDILARVIHERRLEEALRKQRHWHAPENGFRRPSHWRASLGDRLIALGLRLKMQTDTTSQIEHLV
jgi:hypothetical protein